VNRRSGFGRASTDLPLLLVLVSAGLAIWPAHNRDACWPTLAAIASGAGLYFLVSRVRGSERVWRVLAGASVIPAVVLSAYFISQYRHLGYAEKLPYLDQLAAWLGSVSPRLGDWAPDRNSVATALEGIVFLAAGLAAASRGLGWRAAWSAAALVILAGLALSASRGAWLGVGAASAVWLTIRRPWAAARPAAASLAVALPLIVGLAWLVAVVWWPESTGSGAIAPALDRPDRVTLYRQSAALIGDYAYTGAGLGGQFAMLLSRYVLLIQVPFLTYSHNLYLETWLEMGLPGMLALAWLVTAFLVSFMVVPQLRDRTLAQAAGLGLLATFLHGLVDARQYVDLWSGLPLFALLGLHAALITPGETAPMKRMSRAWSAGVVLGLMAVVGAATWPVAATWHANLGAVRQAQADLGGHAGGSAPAADLAAADAHFRAAFSSAPGHRTANLRLALLLMAAGRHNEAVGHAAVAWRVDQSDLTTRKALGLACVWTGDLQRAEPLLRAVPGIVGELNAWGWWRASRRETALAVRAYRMSLAIEPDQDEVRRAISDLDRASQQSSSAKQ
jgi:hypothetical protein